MENVKEYQTVIIGVGINCPLMQVMRLFWGITIVVTTYVWFALLMLCAMLLRAVHSGQY
jgi:hypothetical protein